MILSLTFWKIVKGEAKEEKKFIHTTILWHPIWKDLEFWQACVHISISEELRHQKSLNLEDFESQNEKVDRKRNVVFGHLATFSHNMIAFMVEKSDVKRIIK